MTDLSELNFFITHPHPCSYLDDEQALTVFVDPAAQLNQTLYTQLSNLGFRRSGSHVYKPKCSTCNACIAIRVPTSTFTPNRSQMRCLKRNTDIKLSMSESIDDDEYFSLYEKYINKRHSDGDMYPATREQYSGFLTKEWGITQYLSARDANQKLISVAVIDVLSNGLSAIYTFYDPDENKRSLGVFGILSQIQWAQQMNLPFVFLGYWVKDCQKMNYKSHYKPYQLFIDNHWVTYPGPSPKHKKDESRTDKPFET